MFVVIGEKGKLCDDDTDIKTLPCPIELMIANQNRMKTADDANVRNDEADDADDADNNEDGDIDANTDDDDSYVDVDEDEDEDEEDNDSLDIDDDEICCGYFKGYFPNLLNVYTFRGKNVYLYAVKTICFA